MRFLFRSSQSEDRLNLLLSLTKISSEGIKSALRDHLVNGYDVSNSAELNGVAQQNVDRALSQLEQVAQTVEAIKDHDSHKFSVKWCKCHENN